jgi:hypothetical protein
VQGNLYKYFHLNFNFNYYCLGIYCIHYLTNPCQVYNLWENVHCYSLNGISSFSYQWLQIKQDSGKFVMIDEAFAYMAVAESRQFFALMTPYVIQMYSRVIYCMSIRYCIENSRGIKLSNRPIFGKSGRYIFTVQATHCTWIVWTNLDTIPWCNLLDL